MKLNGIYTNNPQLAAWLLRYGLAFVFAYAAISSLLHPFEWIGYMPGYLTGLVSATALLKIFALIELGLAAWLIIGRYVRWAALFAALMLAGIVIASPSQLIVTFRDIGLIAMALALAAIATI